MKTQSGVSIYSLVEQRLRRGLFDVRRFSVVHTKLDLVPFVLLCVEQPQVVQVLRYGRFSRGDDFCFDKDKRAYFEYQGPRIRQKYYIMLPGDHSVARSTAGRSILAPARCFDSFPCVGLDVEQPKVAVMVEGVLIERREFAAG